MKLLNKIRPNNLIKVIKRMAKYKKSVRLLLIRILIMDKKYLLIQFKNRIIIN